MRKFLSLLLFLACFGLISQLAAQGESKRTLPFGQQLWYGGNFALGLSSGNGVSIFQLGISPMVGYKFSPMFSAGPRVSLIYNNFRVRDFNDNVTSSNVFTWSAGMFGRARIIQAVFAHVEYAYENEAFYDFNSNDVFRRTRGNVYVGAGYNSSDGRGGFGSEIMILYNTSVPNSSFESPWDIRVGFTYNF